ncbi:hypothetical protein AAK938_09615 [Aerococcaceae bacterium 50-4]
MVKLQSLKLTSQPKHSKVKSGFTFLEIIYSIFFYALIQFTFTAVMSLEINIYERFENMAYDDFDIFSNQMLTDHTQTNLVSYTANTLSLIEDNKVGIYRFYKDNNGHIWINYSLNGGYEPQIPKAIGLKVEEVSEGNFLFNVTLADEKSYALLLPLLKEG